MAETRPRAVIVGAGGVFGRRVARELRRLAPDAALVLVGRREAPLRALAAELGAGTLAADATTRAGAHAVAGGARVVVLCAGPFQAMPGTLARTCAAAGVSYVDLSDDRALYRAVEELGPAFVGSGAAATSGASSLPAVSGALVEAARGGFERLAAVGVSVYAGNDAEKGDATVAGVLLAARRPVRAIRAGREVALPALEGPVPLEYPFGERPSFRIDAPDHDVWPARLPGLEVEARASLDRASLGRALRLARTLRLPGGVAAALGRAFAGRDGLTGGAVRAELRGTASDRPARAVGFVWTSGEGQAIASLPAALVAAAMLRGEVAPGFHAPFDALGPGGLLRALEAEGLRVERPEILPA